MMTDSPSIATPLECFLGPVEGSAARLYIAGERQGIVAATGPHNQFARTLPGHWSAVDLGDDPSPLAQIDIGEPCLWSPESPAQYDLVDPTGQAVMRTGLRPLGVRGSDLLLAGKRIVLRLWEAPKSWLDHTPAWQAVRDESLGLVLVNPCETVLQAASAWGIPLMVRQNQSFGNVANYPAVFLVESEHSARRGVLIAGRDCQVAAADQLPQTSAPLLAHRPADAKTPREARQACEALQRDLAPRTNLAGYLV